MMIWPVLQTINYCVIPVNNRLIFVSFAGLVWTTFLAYRKYDKNKILSTADQNINDN